VVGCYLCQKGVLQGREVSRFEMVNIPFKWQEDVSTAGKTDCAVYMMLHMLFYCGDLFDCDLSNIGSRNLYRTEIAATLVLSDINSCREELLTKVTEFEKAKEVSLPIILDERKLVDEEKARRLSSVIRNDGDKCESSPLDDYFSPPIRNEKESQSSTERTVLGSRKRGARKNNGDGMGCLIDCAAVNDSGPAVSTFMRTNNYIFKKILPLRRLLLDYCFLDDHDFPTW